MRVVVPTYLLISALSLYTSLPAAAQSVAKWESKQPSVAGYVDQSMFDIERRLIHIDRMSVPYVYRQPDRPDFVMLIWQGRPGVTKARADLSRAGAGTTVKIWMDNDEARRCAPISLR